MFQIVPIDSPCHCATMKRVWCHLLCALPSGICTYGWEPFWPFSFLDWSAPALPAYPRMRDAPVPSLSSQSLTGFPPLVPDHFCTGEHTTKHSTPNPTRIKSKKHLFKVVHKMQLEILWKLSLKKLKTKRSRVRNPCTHTTETSQWDFRFTTGWWIEKWIRRTSCTEQ